MTIKNRFWSAIITMISASLAAIIYVCFLSKGSTEIYHVRGAPPEPEGESRPAASLAVASARDSAAAGDSVELQKRVAVPRIQSVISGRVVNRVGMPLADVKLWASRVTGKPAENEMSNSNFRKLDPRFRPLNLQIQETELITNGRGEFQLDKTEPGEIWSFRVIDRQMYNYNFFADEASESTRETAPSNHVNIKISTGILEIDLVPPLGSDDVFQGKRTIQAHMRVECSGSETPSTANIDLRRETRFLLPGDSNVSIRISTKFRPIILKNMTIPAGLRPTVISVPLQVWPRVIGKFKLKLRDGGAVTRALIQDITGTPEEIVRDSRGSWTRESANGIFMVQGIPSGNCKIQILPDPAEMAQPVTLDLVAPEDGDFEELVELTPGGMLQVDVSGAENGWASLHLFSATDAARALEIPGYFSDTLDRTSSCFVQVSGQKYQFDRALPEGDYILHASGPSARDVPFTIKKGAVTSVEFRVTEKGN